MMKRNLLIVIILLLLITGCKSKETEEEEETISNAPSIINVDDKSYYQDENYNLDIEYSKVTVLKDYEEYKDFVEKNKLRLTYDEKTFEDKILLFIFANSGKEIKFNDIDVKEDGTIYLETKSSDCLESPEKKRQFAVIKVKKEYVDLNYKLKKKKIGC